MSPVRQRPFRFLLLPTLLLLAAAVGPALAGERPERNVTFISTSDPHYRESERREQTDRNRLTVLEINEIHRRTWPEELGGGPIDPPRGVLMLGDCIDDGDRVIDGKHVTPEQYRFFVADFGLDGTDGLLRFPVFETWGNHDGPPVGKERHGFSFQAHLKRRNRARKAKGLIDHLSTNKLHYSWDWDDVHFVSLGIYPADEQRDAVRYSAVWHDPQDALTFLKTDLAENVGQSGRPVVLMSHCGVDTNWWLPPDWRAFYNVAKPYNVVLYLYGHTGTGVRNWAPEGEAKKWLCINDGNTTTGFFVIQIAGQRLRAAYRCKQDVERVRQPDKTVTHHWSGRWGWRFPVDRDLGEMAKTRR
jgi:cytolysin (calcineurin-like family phosphatase)